LARSGFAYELRKSGPSGAIGQLFEPVASDAFVGLWLQFGGASVAVIAAAVATMRDVHETAAARLNR
jgi:hypothetical protein